MHDMSHLQKPIVGRSPALELQRAEGVGDVLQRVHDAVRVVVGGVDAPALPGFGVGHVLDAVGDQVKHVVVLVLHVLLHPVHQSCVTSGNPFERQQPSLGL